MPELIDEELIPFSAGIRSLPGRPHISSGYRYITRGIRGVVLESIVVGGRRWTSRQALRRFIAAVTAAANQSSDRAASPAVKPKVTLVDETIERDLDAEGF